jgi:hypothetical protein
MYGAIGSTDFLGRRATQTSRDPRPRKRGRKKREPPPLRGGIVCKARARRDCEGICSQSEARASHTPVSEAYSTSTTAGLFLSQRQMRVERLGSPIWRALQGDGDLSERPAAHPRGSAAQALGDLFRAPTVCPASGVAWVPERHPLKTLLQWVIGCATGTRLAGRPLLCGRFCAKFSLALWLRLDELQLRIDRIC